MVYGLNRKRSKIKWSSFKISILHMLFLSFFFTILHKLSVKYFSYSYLLSDIHLVNELFLIFISSLILYTIIRRDRKEILASQKKLQENQKTLYTLINNIPDLVYLKDKEGHWIEANTASLRFFETENTPYKGKTSADNIKLCQNRNGLLPICNDTDNEAWSSKRTVRFEQNFEKEDGSSLIYDVIKVPIFDTHGNRQMLVITARDITERKIMENRLRESEQRYESLYNAISGGVVLQDSEGTVLHANEEACKILGVKSEELHGVNPKNQIWKFVKEDGSLLPYEEQPHTVVFRTRKRIQNFVVGLQRSSHSSCRWILANYEPVFDTPNGPPTQVLSTFLDITNLKQTEEKLKESEERYRLLVEHLPDRIGVVSDGVFSFINKAGATIMGAKKTEEVIGKNAFSFIQKNYRNDIKRIVDKVEREKVIIGPSEYKIVTSDHKVIDVETIFIPITYERKPATLYVSRTITERKRMEEALRKADTLSIAGNLAAGVAHEVRNPLTVIRGFIQLFKQQYRTENNHFDIVLAEVDRIELIISEFLMLSKPQSLECKENYIQKIIQHTVALFETQAIMKNIEIIAIYDDNLPLIECEENQLKQVFINLLKNAMEAMPEGGTITVEVKRREEGIVIFFTDQGCGIPAEKITKLGEPFYTTKEKGTGLGLMVSYNIIKNHKGKINVTSTPQEGTSFEIFLPFTPVTVFKDRQKASV